MKKKIIVQNEENKRIDAFISNIEKEYSRTAIQRLIEEGKILVNNKKVKTSIF